MKTRSAGADRCVWRRTFLRQLCSFGLAIGLTLWGWIFTRGSLGNALATDAPSETKGHEPFEKVTKSDEEWRRILTPEQFGILRRKGTEPAFAGQYHDLKARGIYQCAACNNNLFSSETKFDSGTGWPSFWAPMTKQSVREESDYSFFMKRIEVLCNRCDGHLGHVFDDGPPPTELRYCINSAALRFVPKGQEENES